MMHWTSLYRDLPPCPNPSPIELGPPWDPPAMALCPPDMFELFLTCRFLLECFLVIITITLVFPIHPTHIVPAQHLKQPEGY